MRRQSVGRWLVALLLPVLTAAAIYVVQRMQVYLMAPEHVRARLENAQREFSKGRTLSQIARATREKALELFNGKLPEGSEMPQSAQGARFQAEQQWGLTLTAFDEAQSAFTSAEKFLEDALELAPEHPGVRRLLMELTLESIEHNQAFYRADDRVRLQQRLERLAAKDTDWRNRLEAPAEFELVTTPPSARVELTPHASAGEMRGKALFLTTPVAHKSLPAGGYHLRITQEGRAAIEMPLLLEHGKHKALHLALPKSQDVPEGYVYVPPDCFFAGSADPDDVRKFLLSAPLQQRCLKEGYLIGKTEVTLRDWMEYLDSLPKNAPAQRILAEFPSGGGPALRLIRRPAGGWSFALRQASGNILEAREGEPIRYPGRIHRKEQDWRFFPLAGVSAEDLKGYFAWLDRSGRVPGARLCNELEWVRAARGADNRRYPHGNRMEDDDANMDLTYGASLEARGPDQVGLRRASASPFGLLDMAGNVFEMATSATKDIGDIVILGGAWHYGSISTVVANRQAYTDSFRDARVGARVCASLPAQ
jgi:formylglycine-generating enzyme required for sulfatase activity